MKLATAMLVERGDRAGSRRCVAVGVKSKPVFLSNRLGGRKPADATKPIKPRRNDPGTPVHHAEGFGENHRPGCPVYPAASGGRIR